MRNFVLYIFGICNFVHGSNFVVDEFIHRQELYDVYIDAVPTLTLDKIRSSVECGTLCTEYCYMYSYNWNNKTCGIYTGPQPDPVQATGNHSSTVYYRRIECPRGMYLSENDCLSCDKGSYQNQSGQSSCTECPDTYYQDQYGGETCKPCLNTTEWRYGTNAQKSVCRVCWGGFNTYTDGDMANIITTVTTTSSATCARECDAAGNCLLFTLRRSQSKCYLHSTKTWKWGYVRDSVIYFQYC